MRGSVLTAGLLLLGLTAACAQGTGDEETPDASFDSEAQLTGTLDAMGFGETDEVATARLEEAKKALGDVEVKLIEGELDVQQFLSSVAAGDPPAILYAERDQVGTFASRGAIVPLDECIDGEGIDTDVFDDAALEQVTFEDEVYGIPEFSVVQLTMANRDLLDQAGLAIEDVNGSSWESITEANEELARQDGKKVSVIGYDSKLPEFLPLWAKANGADLISEDGRTAQLDDPAVVEALEWAVDIYDAQGGFGSVKAFRDQADFFGDGNQFATGTLGAMPMEQWYVNVLNEVSPDAPLAFDTVRDRSGETIAWTSGSAWAIPKGSPNPEAACRFAKVMTQTSSWEAAADARLAERKGGESIFTGILTGNDEADEAVRAKVEPSGDEVWDSAVEAMYEASENTFALPANPAGAEFEAAWQDAVNRVLNGQEEPEQALQKAQEEAQKVLDEAWARWDE
ncbi:ABC transporter substrate-binding protein [Nocardioides gansuensis]|uniref:ABC transporter substrate-binding protein n=1 Tax=Nocardioides gansuensis TaxID=2138300 RepID=A0A2T8F5D7_9ACTN|nr:extracellular solute-binding protein [Nocardioides gansuensis]PVG80941.1 ABC transporter substrate-binding protein [Nocardioides gansuensis]